MVIRLLVVIVLVWLRGRGALSASPAKHGCPNTCGFVHIPFPFGIGTGCYANRDLEITCNKSSNPPKPYLTSYNLEVEDISLWRNGYVRIYHPVLASACPNGTNVHRLVNFSTSFWLHENYNYFMAMGCDNLALMRNQGERITGGCTSICNSDNLALSDGGSCYGVNCCKTTIPPSLSFINASVSGIESNNTVSLGCKSAFILDQVWFDNVLKNLSKLQEMETVPAMLAWGLQGQCNGTEPILCARHAECWESANNNLTYRCYCRFGPGNPYLPNGCPADKQKETMIILGISTVFGLVLVIIGTWRLCKLVKRRKKLRLKRKFFKRNGGLLLQQQLSSADQGNVEKNKLFTSKELEKATNQFSDNRILGQGGQGTVYKGMLIDGRIVAVKKSKIVDEGNLEQFINEVVILSQINHRNVVKLHGCCLESEVPLLVYEYIPNGNLYEYIHDQNEEFPLTWDIRVRIATEVSGAIAYLHSAASIPIYHRDIKSTNILLDEKYRAKVSDFGTSKSIAMDQTHMTTLVQGTFGYLDPEYFQSSQFTEKSDVYSFGVVLVELLTGQKAISSTRTEERSLATFFICTMKENCLLDILDARVSREGGKKEIMQVAILAKRCLNLSGRKRPTMKEVAMELEGIRMSQAVSTIEHNYEEDEYAVDEVTGNWDVASTSNGSHLDGSVILSPNLHPFVV